MADNITYPGVIPPPPGRTANILHPSESIAYRLILASSLCPFFALVFVTLRLYTAKRVVRKIFTDDWLIILGLLFSAGYAIINGFQTRHGAGYHLWDVTTAMANKFNTMGAPASICYNLGTIFIKTSILSFYLRFAVSNRPFQIAAYITFFIVIAYSFVMAILPLWRCQPMKKHFDYTIPGHCADPMPPFLVQAAVNSATDIVLLLMPVWLMWPLAMPKAQKIGLSLILMAGGFVCAVSFVRLAAILETPDYGDYTWAYTPNLIWCIVEMNVGVICACLPYIKFLIDYHFPGFFKLSPDIPAQGHEFSVFGAVSLQLRRWSRRLGLGSKRDPREDTGIWMNNLESRPGAEGTGQLYQRGAKKPDTTVAVTKVSSDGEIV